MFTKALTAPSILAFTIATILDRPKIVVPMLGTWVIYLAAIFNWPLFEGIITATSIFQGFVQAIVLYSVVNSIASLITVNMIFDLESHGEISLSGATIKSLVQDFVLALPITIIWAAASIVLITVHLIYAIIALVFRVDAEKDELTATNLERGPVNIEGDPLPTISLGLLSKSLRMSVFLVFPAIAWEGYGPIRAVRSSVRLIKERASTFATGFLLTELLAVSAWLPPLSLLSFARKLHYEVSDSTRIVVYFFCLLVWSFATFIEQLLCAELYLWDLKWRKAVAHARLAAAPIPDIEDIPRPSILDNIPDLKFYNRRKPGPL